eukprot:CAMPEP_0172442996 /NCGR_PEP_ID=MMETSP1065-20121228/3313_1 /TAXON_ID=265537 /ORGANISM="Amphiprora paludosa, Strain CCMP125" /LENGTH=126 /DNA_ID=CAMNT_0013193049 /DNA_START=100 /DNA_END=477 /DNA_ORIENTATION=-
MALIRSYVPKVDKLRYDLLFELAQLQTELAARKADLLLVKPSLVAYCSMANAFLFVGDHQQQHGRKNKTNDQILSLLFKALRCDDSRYDTIVQVQKQLFRATIRAPQSRGLFMQVGFAKQSAAAKP